MDNVQAVEYLKTVNVVKLQIAARFAGLSFKNGAPGYDKNGIIEKLSNYGAMLQATVAYLRRMEAGETQNKTPVSFDAEDFQDSDLPATMPENKPSESSPDSAVLKSALFAVSNRLAKVEGAFITREDAFKADSAVLSTVGADIRALKADIEKLQERRPIEITIKDKPVISIPPGAHKSYPKLLQYLQINRRVILTGSAGTGKSMAVHNAAKAFGLPFYLQTPVTMSHEYLGHRDAQGNFHETPTFQAYTKGGLLLWDEADAGLPDAMLAANPIFDGNGFATFGDGNIYPQHPDFMAVFNMNTDGNGATMQYAGRNRLDGATLARFGVRIHWDIDADIEASMAGAFQGWHKAVKAVRTLMEARGIVDVNATPRHVKTGAALLAQSASIPRVEILRDVLKSGALAEVWADVERLPEVSAFLRGA